MRTRTRAEPGSAAQIKAFVAKYGVKFTMMKKVEVNGDKAHAVFKWLKVRAPPAGPGRRGALPRAVRRTDRSARARAKT